MVTGMGGSALSAGLIKAANPKADVIIHRNYGLPKLAPKDLKERLLIVSSYSGNTEEELDDFAAAKRLKLPMAVVSTGGKLLRAAMREKLPYVELPHLGIQPRMALGFSAKALLRLMGDTKGERDIRKLSGLSTDAADPLGYSLAEKLVGKVPVIYASEANEPIAYTWKIKFNETGKVPAFHNILPELNHNEMTGFDGKGESARLAQGFFFILLKDRSDHPRIKRRMEVLADMLRERKLGAEEIELLGNGYEKIFSSFPLADWASYYLAYKYGSDPEAVPMVEEFKKKISNI